MSRCNCAGDSKLTNKGNVRKALGERMRENGMLEREIGDVIYGSSRSSQLGGDFCIESGFGFAFYMFFSPPRRIAEDGENEELLLNWGNRFRIIPCFFYVSSNSMQMQCMHGC